MISLGVIFALVALVGWGFGDFFIQRASRKVGIIESLMFNTLAVMIFALPFVYKDIGTLWSTSGSTFLLLIGFGVVIFFTAVWQYYVLEVGKLAVVEPVISLELPLTVLISAFLAHEVLGLSVYILIAVVFIGILLSVSPTAFHIGKIFRRFEKGTFIALIAAGGMAATNFLFGYGSQTVSPLLSLWIIHTIITIMCAAWLLYKNRLSRLRSALNKAPGPILAETFFDNIAWIGYSFAVVYIPISVAITISEGYIILAVLLGVLVNKEKLRKHQFLGVSMAIIGVLLLSWITA